MSFYAPRFWPIWLLLAPFRLAILPSQQSQYKPGYPRKGNIVWLAPNQGMGPKQSIEVPLFAIPSASAPSASKRARPGKAQAMGDVYSDAEVSDTIRVHTALERAPTQHMWLHPRFKTAFDGSDKAVRYESSTW